MGSEKENRRGTASCRVRGPVRVGPGAIIFLSIVIVLIY